MSDNNLIKRESTIDRKKIDVELRTAVLSFSSEAPIQDSMFGPPQVLIHDDKAVSLERIRNVGALLFNHSADAIIGSIEDIAIDTKARRGHAVVKFDETADGETAFTRVKSGSLRGVSFAAHIREKQVLREDEKWKSGDGREWEGPLAVATKWEISELSLTPVPADQSVGIGRQEKPKEAEMALTAEMRQLLIERGLGEGFTDEEAVKFLREHWDQQKEEPKQPEEKKKEDDDTASRSSVDMVIAERKRIEDLTKIQEKSGLPTSELTRWIQAGTPVGGAREIAMEFMAERFRPVSVAGTRFEVVLEAREKHRRAMQATIERRAIDFLNGRPKTWAWDDKACADVPRDLPIVEIARQCLVHAGIREAASWGKMEVATRALQHSTSDFPLLLENTANKSLGIGYNEARVTWSAWCGVGSLPDFKVTSRVAVGDMADFEVVAELMPITESTMTEKRETRQLSTYAKRFGVSRQAIINDDLGEFSRTPQKLGAAANRTINTLVYGQLTSPPTMAEDSVALFGTHTSGSNTTVAAGAPSIGGLNGAMSLMRRQLNVGGNGRVNVSPSFLISPATVEGSVRQLVQGTINPNVVTNVVLDWMSNLTPVIEPLLDDTSTSTWYLAASPNEIDTVRVEFLNGQQTPSLTRIDGTAILGTEWVAYLDFSVKTFDHRGLCRVTVT